MAIDDYNSPHISKLEQDQKDKLKKIIAEFDQGKIRTSKELATKINNEIYYKTPNKVYPPSKYQGLNLTRMIEEDGKSTIEFRGVSPQLTPEEFMKQVEMFKARVNFLKTQDGYVRLLDIVHMEPKQMTEAYRSYIEESGLKWDIYKHTIRNYNLSKYVNPKLEAKSRIVLDPILTPPTPDNISKLKACSNFLANIFSAFR